MKESTLPLKKRLLGGYESESVLVYLQTLMENQQTRLAQMQKELEQTRAGAGALLEQVEESRRQSEVTRHQTEDMLTEARNQKEELLTEAKRQKEDLLETARNHIERLLTEARNQREKLLKTARQQADDLLETARQQADELLETAKRQEEEMLENARIKQEQLTFEALAARKRAVHDTDRGLKQMRSITENLTKMLDGVEETKDIG